jgi:hypothetical protein
MGYNVHDLLKNFVAYYTRKHNFFGYDMKLLSFKKMKHWIYKESTHFQKFIFIQILFFKNVSCIWTIISIYYKNSKNNCLKIHLYEKIIFGQKDMWSSSKVMSLVHFILFAPIFTFCFIVYTPQLWPSCFGDKCGYIAFFESVLKENLLQTNKGAFTPYHIFLVL